MFVCQKVLEVVQEEPLLMAAIGQYKFTVKKYNQLLLKGELFLEVESLVLYPGKKNYMTFPTSGGTIA